MKNLKLLISALILTGNFSFAQGNLNGLIENVKTTINGSGTKLTNDEVVSGLKEALNLGANNSGKKASALDGFYKNSLIKIPFPPEAIEMERTLKNLGMGPQIDEFIKTLNRAAEEAAKDAAPIFVNAIKSMSIMDGINILKGSDNAATSYLQQNTTPELSSKFKPVVKNALAKVQITKYWNPLFKKYNKIPMVKKVNPNLEEYVTKRAMEGMFKLVAEEELKIRKDPGSRISDILKKVFG